MNAAIPQAAEFVDEDGCEVDFLDAPQERLHWDDSAGHELASMVGV